jgi:ribose transport system ATP-binding protein
MNYLLEIRELAKSYGSVIALRNANFSVLPGEIHALMGANGAGKSTLVKILTGVIEGDTGEIRVNGAGSSSHSRSFSSTQFKFDKY